MNIILEKIYKSTLKLLDPILPGETYKIIVDEAVKLVGADGGAIYIAKDGEFKTVYASMPFMYEIRPRKKANTYKAFITRQVLIMPKDKLRSHPDIDKLGIQSGILIPLAYERKAIGVLALASKTEDRFSEEESRILSLFGSMVTLAIRKTELYEEINKALEARDQFISMAAHELRTPLTSIHGYIQLLQTKNHKDETEIRWLDQLYFQSTRMTHLVNELLEINKIQSGKFEYNFQEVDIKELVDKVLYDYQFIHSDRKFVFRDKTKAIKSCVIADRNKISQVLVNILDNAIKFSEQNTTIRVDLSENYDNLVVRIKDQGTGISDKDIGKIFEPYYRGKNHVKEGLGVGLFLVKNIIEQHNGELIINSKLNKGTSVEIKLPKFKI